MDLHTFTQIFYNIHTRGCEELLCSSLKSKTKTFHECSVALPSDEEQIETWLIKKLSDLPRSQFMAIFFFTLLSYAIGLETFLKKLYRDLEANQASRVILFFFFLSHDLVDNYSQIEDLVMRAI